jgi:hypothetical protein
MKKSIIIGIIALATGICLSALAGSVMKSVSVAGHIEQISCSNGTTSVITSVSQNTVRVYNYDISGNLLSTLTISGSN